MADLDLYVSIAAALEESGWSDVFSKLDKETLDKVFAALATNQDVAEAKEEEAPSDDPAEAIKQINTKMTKVARFMKSTRKRFQQMDQRMKLIEAGGGGGGGTAASAFDIDDDKPVVRRTKPRKLKTQADASGSQEDSKEQDSFKERKHFYKFGSRRLQVVKPTQGYPSKKDAKMKPQGKLELFHCHGYSGKHELARENLCLSKDGSEILYYIAAVGIVYNHQTNKMRFFTQHSDDIGCICVDPRPNSTLVATGQKDPKDTPGAGKDFPKIWIWDYKNMKGIKVLEDICYGYVNKVQWSLNGTLYCVGGDDDQTLKAWDPKDLKSKSKDTPKELIKCNTTREQILGFKISPTPNAAFHDEIVFYGKRKYSYMALTLAKKGLSGKIRSVTVSHLKKDDEKLFACCEFLPNGLYAVGGSSGAIYINKGNTCLSVVVAHEKCVGDMIWDSGDSRLITTGFDKCIKKFEVSASKSGGKGNDTVTTKGDKKGKKGSKSDKNKGGGSGGGVGLTETFKKDIEIPDSDFILQPKAMCHDPKQGKLFIGTKTNQIMSFDMNGDEEKEVVSKVIVDGHDGEIWGLCTHPKESLFATGGYDNAIKVWDAETMECVYTYEFELPQGSKKGKEVVTAAWSNDGGCLVFGTEDSNIAVFKWDSGNRQCEFQQMINIPPKNANAEVENVSYLRFSEDSTLLGAAHMDSNLYIFSVDGGAGGRYVLTKWDGLPHVAAPTHIQFSEDSTVVKTFTRDYEICHWKLNSDTCKGKFVARIPDPDKIRWGGDPLIAGWDVEGLYQKGWDGTDLNDATLTSDNKLIITGDDYGVVRLHNYPAIDQSACAEYTGHAEFVVGVELLRDDSQLITCGGADMSIFQWKLHKKE